eukprot:jgi/Tetstr1/445810/TSEL_033451.t1
MADYRGAPSLPPRPSYSVALSGGAARRGGMTAWEVSGLAVGVTQLRDTTTFCNILMLDANLHTADQHMRQMHNNGVMENLASRLQELDKQILEIPDIAHATHKSQRGAAEHDDHGLRRPPQEDLRYAAARDCPPGSRWS